MIGGEEGSYLGTDRLDKMQVQVANFSTELRAPRNNVKLEEKPRKK